MIDVLEANKCRQDCCAFADSVASWAAHTDNEEVKWGKREKKGDRKWEGVQQRIYCPRIGYPVEQNKGGLINLSIIQPFFPKELRAALVKV